MIRVAITSAAPADFISHLSNKGIVLYNIQYSTDLSVTADVKVGDYYILVAMAQQQGSEVERIQNRGVFFLLCDLLRRPILIFGLFLWFLFALILPTRILFVEVRGNEMIPTNLILEKAEQSGIYFGVSRRDVRSERIKNALLSKIPQLQWIGVNTYGCVAVISVEEQTDFPEAETHPGVSSIVACHDGIICDVTVERGTALCAVGDAVSGGQTLVSGFTDCGLSIRAEHASAKIYAYTLRYISAVTPQINRLRCAETKRKRVYSIKIGKNIINFTKDSGISDTRCAKIYSERYVTLPGGFVLPVSFIEETYIHYNEQQIEDNCSEVDTWMPILAEGYLLENTVEGEILQGTYNYADNSDAGVFEGLYFCKEMIGRNRDEEIYNGE